MHKATVISAKLTKVGSMNLPSIFSEKVNKELLAQAIRVYEWRKHSRTSKVKTRGEVVASTKKIYKQKHTGRARHGAISAPIFAGGGVAHGPKGISRTLTLPKNLRVKAKAVALSLKAKDKNVVVVSNLDSIKKTKDASALVQKIYDKSEDDKVAKNLTLALSDSNKNASIYFRNLKDVKVMLYKNLNAFNVHFGGKLAVDKEVFTKGKKTKE